MKTKAKNCRRHDQFFCFVVGSVDELIFSEHRWVGCDSSESARDVRFRSSSNGRLFSTTLPTVRLLWSTYSSRDSLRHVPTTISVICSSFHLWSSKSWLVEILRAKLPDVVSSNLASICCHRLRLFPRRERGGEMRYKRALNAITNLPTHDVLSVVK